MCNGNGRLTLERAAAPVRIAHVSCRPLRRRLQRRDCALPVLTHSRTPALPDIRHSFFRYTGIQPPFVTVCGSRDPAIFDA